MDWTKLKETNENSTCAILGLRSFGDFATEAVFEAVGFLRLVKMLLLENYRVTSI